MALIHWWPLNGDTKDYGLNPVSLTNNGATVNDSGKIGKCYSFDGSNDYLSATITITSEMSFTCWLKFNAGGVYHILDCRSTASGNPGYQPLCAGVDYGLQFYSSSSGSLNVSASNCGFATGTWYHLALTISNNGIKAYVNGNLVGSNSNTGYDFGPQTLKVGTRCTNQYWFNGLLNDLRVYDHALTPKEIKEISKALILHYNPDQAIRSSCWTGGYFGYYGVEPAQSTVSDPSLPSGDYRKITWTANGSVCGPYFANLSPSTNGATYTTSFYWKAKGYTPSIIRVENYSSQQVYTTLALNGWWYTQIVGTYNASAKNVATTFYATPPNGTACELDVSSIKIELGDFATPYRRDNKSYIPDASGFGHDGTIVSESIEKSTDHRYKKNVVADGNPEHYIQSNINPSFLTSGVTFNVWYKNITNKTFLVANGQSIYHYVMAINDVNKYCYNVSGAAYYIDGQLRTTADGYPKDGQWHMYTSVHTSIGSWTALYWNKYYSQWRYNGPLGDIRLYATALSAADIKNLYNETRVTHPMQFLISNSSALSSLTSSNPVLADGELVVVRSTDSAGKTYFNIRKGNGVNNFNSLPWKQISETVLKGWRDSFSSDSTALTADTNSYTQLG